MWEGFNEIVTKEVLVECRRLREDRARWKRIGGRNILDTYFNKRGGCNLHEVQPENTFDSPNI